jgi:hypothetical protein
MFPSVVHKGLRSAPVPLGTAGRPAVIDEAETTETVFERTG